MATMLNGAAVMDAALLLIGAWANTEEGYETDFVFIHQAASYVASLIPTLNFISSSQPAMNHARSRRPLSTLLPLRL